MSSEQPLQKAVTRVAVFSLDLVVVVTMTMVAMVLTGQVMVMITMVATVGPIIIVGITKTIVVL